MQFQQLETLFGVLNKIEDALKRNPEPHQKEVLINSMLGMRNIMDQCVKYWLQFENKLNDMQNKYNFELPDELSDDFLELETSTLETPYEQKESLETSLENTFSIVCKPREESTISFRKGLGFWDLSMLEEAIMEFEKVVKLEPNFIFGHFCLGLAYLQKGKKDQALQKLRLVKSLSQDPQMTSLVHNAIGSVYAQEEKYNKAIEEYSKALEKDPENQIALFNKGISHLNLKQFDKAIEALSQVQELIPADWETLYLLGQAHSLSGEYSKGLEYFKRAFSSNPSETRILFEMGVLYELLGESEKATKCFSKIIED